jgi:phosphoribosylformimino-5-aminoimidazole carboxamide ribotide isomerase
MSQFTIFPAIDLRHGQVVRLAQGDPERQTAYSTDPLAVAERWRAEGAQWLHVVNLDGAFGDDAQFDNLQALRAILATGLKVQFGGGLRDKVSIQRAFELGVTRVVLGTAAIENPALVEWALHTYGPERVAVGIDARDGLVRVRGWAQGSGVAAQVVGQQFATQGGRWCIFTDVARDGLGTGVNVAATAQLAQSTGLNVIASGGVASAQDVEAVRAASLAGVIVGRALYEHQVSFRDLILEQQSPNDSITQ